MKDQQFNEWADKMENLAEAAGISSGEGEELLEFIAYCRKAHQELTIVLDRNPQERVRIHPPPWESEPLSEEVLEWMLGQIEAGKV
jgi:hypothetical protein